MKRLAEILFQLLLRNVAAHRPPDFVVGAEGHGGAYLLRWFLTPWRSWQHQLGKRAEANPTRWNIAAYRAARLLPNLYLHKFLRDDDDRALHDHPSFAVSFILRTGYVEHTIADGGIHVRTQYEPGSLRFMRTVHAHRIELLRKVVPGGGPMVLTSDPVEPCWTLFLFGPTVREWGFHCPERGWVHWKQFTAAGKPGEVGPGCGE